MTKASEMLLPNAKTMANITTFAADFAGYAGIALDFKSAYDNVDAGSGIEGEAYTLTFKTAVNGVAIAFPAAAPATVLNFALDKAGVYTEMSKQFTSGMKMNYYYNNNGGVLNNYWRIIKTQ